MVPKQTLPMKQLHLLAALTLLLVTACNKDDDDPTTPTPAPVVCGIDGARLQATFDGSSFCANASLFASEAGGLMTINGITQQGATLTLELDSLSVGTHAMTETTNTILYTPQLALAYAATDGAPASVTITEHNVSTRRIRGNFSGPLYSPIGGAPKSISGSFDLVYVQ
jgi:hypothetical protein